MREIKFRAWDEDARHMFYPPNNHICMWGNGDCLNLQSGSVLTPLLYTGLKDSSGNEIYEGDIIQCENQDGIEKSVVQWGDDLGAYLLFPIKPISKGEFLYADILEVTGNIYENPELLED